MCYVKNEILKFIDKLNMKNNLKVFIYHLITLRMPKKLKLVKFSLQYVHIAFKLLNFSRKSDYCTCYTSKISLYCLVVLLFFIYLIRTNFSADLISRIGH